VARCSRAAPVIYIWPIEKRPKDARGNPAALHAKCAIADDRVLFISSANLTESAMATNFELGVRVAGAPGADRAVTHWRALIAEGTLLPVGVGTVGP
jgi:phosphatidylserine/phosphatidylglycerophosphate/cardiolipin synthase-like enzyme